MRRPVQGEPKTLAYLIAFTFGTRKVRPIFRESSEPSRSSRYTVLVLTPSRTLTCFTSSTSGYSLKTTLYMSCVLISTSFPSVHIKMPKVKPLAVLQKSHSVFTSCQPFLTSRSPLFLKSASQREHRLSTSISLCGERLCSSPIHSRYGLFCGQSRRIPALTPQSR